MKDASNDFALSGDGTMLMFSQDGNRSKNMTHYFTDRLQDIEKYLQETRARGGVLVLPHDEERFVHNHYLPRFLVTLVDRCKIVMKEGMEEADKLEALYRTIGAIIVDSLALAYHTSNEAYDDTLGEIEEIRGYLESYNIKFGYYYEKPKRVAEYSLLNIRI